MTNLLIVFAVLQIGLTLWGYVDNINGLLKKKPYANPIWFAVILFLPIIGVFAYFQLKYKQRSLSSIFAKEQQRDLTFSKYYIIIGLSIIIGLNVVMFIINKTMQGTDRELPWGDGLIFIKGFLIGLGIALFLINRKEQQVQK